MLKPAALQTMRRRQTLVLIGLVFVAFCFYSVLRLDDSRLVREPVPGQNPQPPETKNTGENNAGDKPESVQWEEAPRIPGGPRPKPVSGTGSHPIWFLMSDAQREHDRVTKKQSQTLADAVKEYRRRYQLPPPPNFDKWFEFATANKVQLIDEFDTIHDLITPFWGLKPKTIRARAKEALGFDNALIGVAIRNHEISHINGGQEWQRNATEGMMVKFLQYLPDMDLASTSTTSHGSSFPTTI